MEGFEPLEPFKRCFNMMGRKEGIWGSQNPHSPVLNTK